MQTLMDAPPKPRKKRRVNVIAQYKQLLDELVAQHYRYHETLIHTESNVPIAVLVAPQQDVTYQLAIYGVWQLTQDGESLAAYIGGFNKDGLLLKKLKQVEGQTITKSRFLPDNFNTFLQFENDMWLRLFCSPVRKSSYHLTEQAPAYDAHNVPLCNLTCYGVYDKGMARAKWSE